VTLPTPLVVHELQLGTSGGLPIITDLTTRWHTRATIRRGKQYERGQSAAGTLTTTYRNNDGYLSPGNGSSPYSPGVVLYAPLRVRAQWPRTQNLLTGDQATGGEASPLAPGAIPASLGIGTEVSSTLTIASSATAFQGSQVFQNAIAASQPVGFYLIKIISVPVAAHSPAAPDITYTWSAYVRCTTTGVNPQVQAAIRWKNSSGGAVGTPTAAAVTLTGSPTAGWTRISLSGAPVAGAVCADIAVALAGTSPSSPWTLQLDGAQFEQAATASTWTAPGTWYYLYNGFVERWPQSWAGDGVTDESGNYTVVRPTVTDCLSLMGRQKLNYAYLEYLLPLGPLWLFQLNESSNGFTPISTQSTGYTSMLWADTMAFRNPVQSWSGDWAAASVSPGASPTAISSSGGFAGVPGPVLQCTADTGAHFASGLLIDHTNPSSIGPPNGAGWSILCAFLATPQTGGTQWTDPIMYNATQNAGGTQSCVTLAINNVGTGTAGTVYVFVQNPSATNINATTTGVYGDGNWHLACGTLSADGKTVTIMVDGEVKSTTGATSYLTGQAYVSEAIGCFGGGGGNGWQGYLSECGLIPYPITSGQFATLYAAWRSAFSGESSGARLLRILGVAGLTFPTQIQAGATAMGPAGDWSSSAALPFQGSSVLSLGQACVDAEQGQMFAAATGTLTFTGRLARSPAPSAGLLPVFGENTGGWVLGSSVLGSTTVPQGEIPYTALEVGYDADQMYDVAQITAYDGLPPVAGTVGQTVTIENAGVVAGPLGVQLYSQNLNISNAAGTKAVAQWIVDNGSTADERITSIRVAPSRLTAQQQAYAWPTLLGMEIGGCAVVKRRPLGGAALSLQQWTENVQVDLMPEPGELVFTYQMSPISKSLG
jgi:hypothetical protein